MPFPKFLRSSPVRPPSPEIGYAWHSRLQLAFYLVEKPPIRPIGDDLLRARFDETCFVQAQGIKADRVLGVVFAPFVVGNFAQRLEGIVVASSETAIDDLSCNAGRFGGAEVGGLQNGPKHTFGC